VGEPLAGIDFNVYTACINSNHGGAIEASKHAHPGAIGMPRTGFQKWADFDAMTKS